MKTIVYRFVFIFIFLKLSCQVVLCQTIFTIGGDVPDFNTINEAIDFLENTTLTETTVFNIRTGTYEESLTIPKINGASEQNRIIFQSESNDPNMVELLIPLTHNVEYDQRSGVFLDGANWITLQSLTLKINLNSNISNISGSVVFLANDAVNNTINNCILTSNFGENTNITGIYNDYMPPNQSFRTTNITDCYFLGGWAGIIFNGLYGNCNIKNNCFESQKEAGIVIENHTSHNLIDISNNELVSMKKRGIFVRTSFINAHINNNKIEVQGEPGIELSNIYDNGSNIRNVITNNVITTEFNNYRAGLVAYGLNDLDIFFNTFSIENLNVSPPAAEIFECSDCRVLNNIFHRIKTGNALAISSVSNIQLDYNNYFSEAGLPLKYHGTEYNLEDFQQQVGLSLNSYSVDPNFIPDTYTPRATELNNAGITLAGFATDIDGNIRNNPPDIGVKEISQPSYDVAIVELLQPQEPIAEGDNDFVIRLKNLGIETIENFRIEWKVNGQVQVPVSWSGNLASESLLDLSLGSYFLEAGINHTFEAELIIEDFVDYDLSNNSYVKGNVIAGLAGVYVIGNSAEADYLTLSDAINNLQFAGAVGAVNFKLESGSYNDQIDLRSFRGMGADNPLVIESLSGNQADLIFDFKNSISNNNGAIQLNDVQYVTFKNMTIKADAAVGIKYLIKIGGTNSTLKFENLDVSYYNHSSSTVNYVYHTPQAIIDGLQINNNKIEGGYYGIFCDNDHTYKRLSNVKFINNNIESHYQGIHITYAVNLNIFDNVTEQLSLTEAVANFRATAANVIVYAYGDVNIERNQFFARNVSALYAGAFGGRKTVVANNFFYSEHPTTIDHNENTSTLFIGNADELFLINNTIIANHNNDKHATLYLEGIGDSYVYNNVIYAKGTGYALRTNNFSFTNRVDYNLYYSEAPKLGQIENQEAFTFEEMRTFLRESNSTNYDEHSLSAPLNISSTPTYKILDGTIDNIGRPFTTTVPRDIENRLRNIENSDLGAYEFSLDDFDISLKNIITPDAPFAAEEQPIQIVFESNGNNIIEYAKFDYAVNDKALQTYEWTGSLGFNQVDTITLSGLVFDEIIENEISVSVELAPELSEENLLNNNISVANLYAGLAGVYHVGSTNDFSTLEAATTALQKGGIIGNVEMHLADGNYSEQIILDNILTNSINNHLVFTSTSQDSSKAILVGQADFIIQIKGGQNIVIQHLGFQLNDLRNGIIYADSAKNCKINNCYFLGIEELQGYFQSIITFDSGNFTEYYNNQITNNLIEFGTNGVQLGASQNRDEYNGRGNLIKQNIFKNQDLRALVIQNDENSVITENQFINPREAMNISLTANLEISRNQFIGLEKYRNGIIVYSMKEDEQRSHLLANNYFQSAANSTFKSAIELNGYFNGEILHNTFEITTVQQARNNTAIAFNQFFPTNTLRVKNNMFANYHGQAFSFVNLDADIVIDHNAYFGNPDIANNNGTLLNLQNWQSNFSYDINSQRIDPYDCIAADYKTYNPALNEVTTSEVFTMVGRDIELNSRNATSPTAGAYEIQNDDIRTEPCTNPLSIYNINLKLDNYQNNIELSWSVSFDDQPGFFQVLRAGKDEIFRTIAEVKVDQRKSYSYVDQQPLAGINFYKIRLVKQNRILAESLIKSAARGHDSVPNIFPNPTQRILFVKSNEHEVQQLQYTVTNLLGQNLFTGAFTLSNEQNQIDFAGLPKGMYLLNLKMEKQEYSYIITKQ